MLGMTTSVTKSLDHQNEMVNTIISKATKKRATRIALIFIYLFFYQLNIYQPTAPKRSAELGYFSIKSSRDVPTSTAARNA